MRFCSICELHKIKTAAGADFLEICAQVSSGRAAFFCVNKAYCVLRRDADGLVVVCVEGAGALDLAPIVVQMANDLNCPSIIFHTKRRAFSRMLNQYPFTLLTTTKAGDYVFKWELLNG